MGWIRFGKWVPEHRMPIITVIVAGAIVALAWFKGASLAVDRREALVALSPIALIIITATALWDARRAARAASTASKHAAEAALAAQRQADSIEERAIYDVLPIVWAEWSRVAGDPEKRSVRLTNAGLGTALNISVRMNISRTFGSWERTKAPLRPGDSRRVTVTLPLPPPTKRLPRAYVLYKDVRNREYVAVSGPHWLRVFERLAGPDGVMIQAETPVIEIPAWDQNE